MDRLYQRFVALFGIVLTVLVLPHSIQAATVAIDKEKPPKAIEISYESKLIRLETDVSPRGAKCQWRLEGPGELDKDQTKCFSMEYWPPLVFDPQRTQVKVSVTVTDNKGVTANDNIIFTLLPPQLSNYTVDQLLIMAKNCFDRQFWTSPQEMNALDICKEALTRPDIQESQRDRAQKMIGDMAKQYNDRWGKWDKSFKALQEKYKQKDSDDAKEYYQNYLKVAQYIHETLQNPIIEKNYQAIQQRLEALTRLDLQNQLSDKLKNYRQLKEQEQQAKDEKQRTKLNRDILQVIRETAAVLQGNVVANEEITALLQQADMNFKKATAEKDAAQADLYRQEYQNAVKDLLQRLSGQFTQTNLALERLQKKGDKKDADDKKNEILYTLNLLETLRLFRQVYEIPQRTEDIARIQPVIDQYESKLLGK